MQHLAAYTASAPINAADFDLAALADPAQTISNGHFVFMVPVSIIGAYGLGASLLRVKLKSPKLQALVLPYLAPVERAAAVPQRPNFVDYSHTPLKLNPIDETAVLVSNNAAAAEQEWALLWIDDGQTKKTQGEVYTIRATTAFTSGVNVWSAGAMIFDQTLPAGRYSVVGMRAFGTNLIAARLVFPGQVWRPGVIGTPAVGTYAGDYFQRGYLGEFGQFESIAQPQVEVLGSAAVVNVEVHIDVIRVR